MPNLFQIRYLVSAFWHVPPQPNKKQIKDSSTLFSGHSTSISRLFWLSFVSNAVQSWCTLPFFWQMAPNQSKIVPMRVLSINTLALVEVHLLINKAMILLHECNAFTWYMGSLDSLLKSSERTLFVLHTGVPTIEQNEWSAFRSTGTVLLSALVDWHHGHNTLGAATWLRTLRSKPGSNSVHSSQ
jgi:hypothetical protein